MSHAPQSQFDFVDIPTNNGCKVGFGTFKNIMKGRYHGEMQLAFEQYLGDCKVYGTAHGSFRYTILNGIALKLQYPSPSGPALAAPVTHPGLQNTNGHTQASGYQTPYASQLNQPVSNFLGPIDPSKVQNMRYPSARTAQKSAPQSRQLNPRAADFKVSSTVNNLSTSAPPSAWSRANTAPARPPGLPEIPQPQFAPANAHRGFFTPDALSNASERYVYPDIIPSAPPLALPRANTAPARPPGLPEIPQPQFAPANAHRGFLAPNAPFTACQCHDCQIFISASPLDLNANFSSAPNHPHPPPPQSSRRSSEHHSDAPSYSSSDEPQSPGFWGLDHGIRLPVPVRKVSKFRSFFRTFNSIYPEANTTNETWQGPQNGGAVTAPWDPFSEHSFYKDETYYSELYTRWWGSERPASRFPFYHQLNYLCEILRNEYDSRQPQGPANTVSHRTEPPAVGNGMNPSPKMAEVDTSALRTQRWVASTSPSSQLYNGEGGNEAGESSSSAHQPTVEWLLEAQRSGEEEEVDPHLSQRLDDHARHRSNFLEEVRTTRRGLERVLVREV
ncbi:hypothetical protein JMJ35_001928 [Cladonia borealis]|uniref:Uncharacterized protein n=1 Tax=Cladonia borealis TaxID=184061 RepID=A0AA39V797_9LECA|nr:hypothetical protein JMJ35_001928 [Cladonia borealis]